MFERYTESARRLLFFARYEASELGASLIEAEHLLLGLVRGNEGTPRDILGLAGVSLEGIRQEVERRAACLARTPTSVEMPFSPLAVGVLEFAREEADRLRHNHIGTEHILLGLLREPGSLAFTVLTEAGVRLDEARNALVRMLGESARPSASSPAVTLYEVNRIKALVLQLANAAPYSDEAWVLVEQINGALDGLKPLRGPYQ